MKRFILLLSLAAVSVLTLSAFSDSSEQQCAAEQQRVVRLTRYEGQPITGISASSGFDVYFVQSDETRVVAEVSEVLEPHLDLSLGADGVVRASLRSVRGFRGAIRNTVLKLTVYLPTLTSLNGSGGADFTGSGTFTSDELKVTMNGGADLESLDIQTGVLRLIVSGGSDAEISGQAGILDATVTGGADADLYLTCNSAKVTVAGGADAELRGEATEATFNASGGGDLDAGDFAVERLTANASSAGGISAWVTRVLRATASSAGSVRYHGNPQVILNRSSSAGIVRKING